MGASGNLRGRQTGEKVQKKGYGPLALKLAKGPRKKKPFRSQRAAGEGKTLPLPFIQSTPRAHTQETKPVNECQICPIGNQDKKSPQDGLRGTG